MKKKKGEKDNCTYSVCVIREEGKEVNVEKRGKGKKRRKLKGKMGKKGK